MLFSCLSVFKFFSVSDRPFEKQQCYLRQNKSSEIILFSKKENYILISCRYIVLSVRMELATFLRIRMNLMATSALSEARGFRPTGCGPNLWACWKSPKLWATGMKSRIF